MAQIFRYVGIGKETEFGNAVDGTIYLDPISCTLDVPAAPEIMVEGGMGRMVARKRPGFYVPSGSIEYPVDIRSMGYLFRAALDGYDFTAGEPEGTNTHEFYGGNENVPTFWTYRVGKDVFEHVFDGCVADTLTLNVADGLATANLGLFARKDASTDLKDFSIIEPLMPAEYPLAFYEVTATINDNVEYAAKVRSANMSIKNNIGRDSGRGLGSQFPRTFRCGARTIEYQIQLQFDDLTHLQLFWGDDAGPDETGVGSTPFPLCLEFDAGDYGEMEILSHNCVMTNIPTQPSKRDVLYQTITCRALRESAVALADLSTVDTDVLVTLENFEATLL